MVDRFSFGLSFGPVVLRTAFDDNESEGAQVMLCASDVLATLLAFGRSFGV